jgi:hypothetical protein
MVLDSGLTHEDVGGALNAPQRARLGEKPIRELQFGAFCTPQPRAIPQLLYRRPCTPA